MAFTAAWFVFAAFVGYYVLLCLRHTWTADFQMYVAGVSRLYVDSRDPGHEALALPAAYSSLYTPYLRLVAGFGKLLSISPYAALQWAGVFNVALYAAGTLYLFSRYSLHFRYCLPAACFLLVTLCLRGEHFGWSSETSLVTFQFVQAYPSTFAWGVAFFSLGLVEDLRRRFGLHNFLLLTASLWALLTCHVITGSWVCGMVGLHALYTAIWSYDCRRLTMPMLSTTLALALTFASPSTSLWSHGASAGVHEPSTMGARPLEDLWNLYLVALPCAVWLVVRQKRHAFWVLGFGATLAALTVWRSLGISFGNRYSLFMGVPAQLVVSETAALGILVIARARPSLLPQLSLDQGDRMAVVTLLLAAVVAGVSSPMLRVACDGASAARLRSPKELLGLPAPGKRYYEKYQALKPYLSSEDVVMTPHSREVFDIAATTGARFASAPGAIRVSDAHDRARAVASYFNLSTTAALRRALLDRYGITKVLLPRAYHGFFPRLQRELGEPPYQDDRFAVFAVPR